jgi:pyruvate dehydrogenase E2 component (dihydrolipoamide acetyltransferase)
MAEVIRMPLLSDTMKEGVIAEWHKKVGDKVKSDDVIAEVETDKATMEVMPYVEGTLLYIGVEKGKAAPVNGIIAIVGKEGEDYKALLEGESKGAAHSAAPEAESAPKEEPKKEAAAAPKAETKQAKPKSGDATVIRMPLLSDTMKEGKIVSWLKNKGDKVKSDDVLAEVETDKATMEVMGYAEGTLLYVGVEAGQAAKVNDIIAIVGKEGTDIAPYLEDDGAEAAPAEENKPSAEAEAPAASKEAASTAGFEHTSGDDRLKISPLARKMAKEKGISLDELEGSGEGGRIIKRDIDNYKPKPAAQPATAAAANVPAFNAGQESHTDKPLSQMRSVVARRLSESKFSAPHFYLRMTIKMDKAIAARTAMNEVSPVKISFNDYIIKACAMALRKHPAVNSSWMGDFIRENHHISIGTAVAIEDGLIVPVIKFADQKSLSQISAEASELIKKARNKKLQPQEFTGNTFTVSNLGMMDIDEFTAIINPPDACILAIGKIEATPVVEDGQVVVRNLLKLTLSCDHRVVDGAVGAAFMQTLKAYLENPVTMLV